MAEDLLISKGTKQEQYETLLPQIKGLLEGEPDLIANLANVVAAHHHSPSNTGKNKNIPRGITERCINVSK